MILEDVHRACVEGDASAVAAYLASPEEVAAVPLDSHAPDWNKKDTFLAAAPAGYEDIACELIAAGASHSALGNRGDMDELPLGAAAMRGSSTRTIRMLLEAGADPRAQPLKVGRSTMGSACSYSSLEAVKLLMQYGADVNAKVPGSNDMIYTVPLCRACRRGPDFVEFLLESGADLLDPMCCGTMITSIEDAPNKESIVPTKTLLFLHGANARAYDKSNVLMAVRAEMATAFACGHHSRMGSRSPVTLMDRATMQSVFQLIFWRH
eukprot:m51a1_g2150 hypothetical protein (266) ;mRNA; f:14379-15502